MYIKNCLLILSLIVKLAKAIELNQQVLFNTLGYSLDSVEIDLDGYNLTILDDSTFKGLSKLKRLNLNSNKLKSISDKIFNGLNELTELWIESNELVYISEKSFNNLTNLEQVCIYNNPISFMFPTLVSNLCKSNPKCKINAINKCSQTTSTTSPISSMHLNLKNRTLNNF